MEVGQIVREPGGPAWLVVRGGARPLGLKAYPDPPSASSFTLQEADLEGLPGPLHVGLEESSFLGAGTPMGRARPAALALLLKKRIAIEVEGYSAVAHAPRRFERA